MLARLAAVATAMLMMGACAPCHAAPLSGDCKPVFDAMEKTLLSNHTTTTTRGNETMRGVTVGGTAYLQINGAWRKSPLTPQDNIAQSRANLKDAKEYSCKALPDGAVDGIPVANFATRTVGSEGDVIDSRIAISRSTGLAVSVENHVGSKVGYMTRYGYTDVKAPL